MSEVQMLPNRLVKRRPVPTYPGGSEAPADAPADAPVYHGADEAIPELEKGKHSKWRMSNPFDKKTKSKEKSKRDSVPTLQRNPHDSAYFSANDPGSSVSEIGSTPNQQPVGRMASRDHLVPPNRQNDGISIDRYADRSTSDKSPSETATSEPPRATQRGTTNDQRVQTTTTTTTVTETRVLGGENAVTNPVVSSADQGTSNTTDIQHTETAPVHVPNPNSQSRPTYPRAPSGPTIPYRSPNRERAELNAVSTPQPQLSETQPQYPVPRYSQQNQHGEAPIAPPVSPSRTNFSYPRHQATTSGGASTGIPAGNPHPAPLTPAYVPDNSKSETGSRIGTIADLKAAASTLHGAGEALRGTLSSATDRAFHGHDPAVLAQHEQIIRDGQRQMATGRVGSQGEARTGGRITERISGGIGKVGLRGSGREGGLTGNPVDAAGVGTGDQGGLGRVMEERR
ncbi:hypothetical protein EJ05DRAFT_503204 [Pseudovirgaria hyperparasitica]|uniref:Uncharacterized protein n=1 Tax=Pseudovirgaria hyperparasitica TaxID=470096 RepID=A0A6A6W3Y7_9PEZI|nr:uncharacterized protein EJ05DRAFT_503204 [Pseudovirgaria hyperparasitica]KAF2755751.1 hypothetical protein EJ05DRAFT_503204 [Pseudovirgaria hyperparasitica]